MPTWVSTNHRVSATCWAHPGTSGTELKKWTYRDPERALRSRRFPEGPEQALRHAVSRMPESETRIHLLVLPRNLEDNRKSRGGQKVKLDPPAGFAQESRGQPG